MCWLRSIKMELYGIIISIQIIRVYSASKIFAQDHTEHLTIAAANIVDECFGSSERWSELLIILDHGSSEIIEKIHHGSKTSNLIIFIDDKENNYWFTHSEKCSDYLNTSVELQENKPHAVIITAHSLNQLQSVLDFLKGGVQTIWRPESNFFIVLETKCDVTECNNMLKIIWDYWILNAVILCSSNDAEIELYTFNPYSGDHSRQWEMIINETVEVSINPGNFNHSWYIFKQRFTEMRSFDDCDGIFFDKTLNLDGYVIPISFGYSEFLLDTTNSLDAKLFAPDSQTLKTLSRKLRFDIAQVLNNDPNIYGHLLENGSYSGIMNDIYEGRSHLAPTMRGINLYPGLGMTYPHGDISICFASRIVGNIPQWTNLAVAKHIWSSLGLGLLFVTVVLYLQNKSHGIVSAFLDAERLIVGSSIIRTPTAVKHRIILGSIFLVLLVVDGAIRGRFVSILSVVRQFPNLDTIEQLNEQGVGAYGHDYTKDGVVDDQLKARFNTSIGFSPGCLEIIERTKRQLSCFMDCLWLRIWASNSTIVHVSVTAAWKKYTTFLTTMHWPMTDRYGVEVQKLVESGIHKKTELNIYRELEVSGWKLKRTTESSYVKPIELNDLLPAFVLLFVGLSVALIIFAWEMIGSKRLRSVRS